MGIKENAINFFKNKKVLVVIIFLIIIFIVSFFIILSNNEKQTSENRTTSKKVTTDYSIEKIVCYSSAYAENNQETQARWNLNLSQYTDIAIYLNFQNDITSLFIDHITFSNPTCYLANLSIEDFAKTPSSNVEMKQVERIELPSNSPITLRYVNQNFKKDCIITDTENPLIFDGSLLKRGKVTLSSLRNTVSFTIHLTDTSSKTFSCLMEIPINLENRENGETIYSGNFLEEKKFTNTYFYY